MTFAVVSGDEKIVAAVPVAREMRDSLALAREALARVPVQPWGEFDGPSLEEIIARIDRVLRIETPGAARARMPPSRRRRLGTIGVPVGSRSRARRATCRA